MRARPYVCLCATLHSDFGSVRVWSIKCPVHNPLHPSRSPVSFGPGMDHIGGTMAGPDSERLERLRRSETPSIRRTADDGVTIEEWDPDRAPKASELLRKGVRLR